MSSTVSAEQTPDGMSGIIEKLMSNGINNLRVQDKYILPPHERPQMSEVSYSQSIPEVDLQDLDGHNRTRVVQEKKNIKLWIGIGKELASYFYGLECLSVYI